MVRNTFEAWNGNNRGTETINIKHVRYSIVTYSTVELVWRETIRMGCTILV